jgi:hypothetical protein
MKNIYLIPADNPSRLGYLINLYITSDEEIKEGDWCYSEMDGIGKWCGPILTHEQQPKKIILTTDQDLIKDGVQAIDEEFLEWFVKNPSCEFVEWSSEKIEGSFDGKNWKYKYGTIIPKEEFKTLPDVNWESDIINKIWDEEEPKQECTCSECDYCEEQESIQILKEAKEKALKQETLEEAAKKYAKIPLNREVDSEERYFNSNVREYDAFKAAANWRAQKMYSDEEVFSILDKVFHMYASNHRKDAKEWFEQHKKK